VVRRDESLAQRQFFECDIELALEAGCQRDVANGPAYLADQVVMMLG
jgi:hypothetical protein